MAVPPTLVRHEWRAWAVFGLAAAATVIELTAGVRTGSAALLAEGLHMGAHVGGFLMAALAYAVARRMGAAQGPRTADGVSDAAALVSGMLMLGLGVGPGLESVDALRHPRTVAYGSALGVAVFGLAVNLVCAVLLHRDHAPEAGRPIETFTPKPRAR